MKHIVTFFSISFLPLAILLDTAIAVERGYRPDSRLEKLLLLAVLSVFFSALFLLLVRRGRRFLDKYCYRLVLLVASLILSLCVAETLIAAFSGPKSGVPFHRCHPNLCRTFHPNPEVMPGIEGPSQFTCNSLGIRGPEFPPPGTAYRILCIGGSTTECLYLDDMEAWPHLLMEQLSNKGQLNVWVGNIGRSGWDSAHHLKFVDTSDLMNRIDCLLVLVGVNDYWRYVGYDGPGAKPLWIRMKIVRHVRNLARRAVREEDDTGQAYVNRRQLRQNAKLTPVLPEGLSDALNRYRKRLRAIADFCRKADVEVIFVSQPVLWSETLSPTARRLLWSGWTRHGEYLTGEALRKGMDLFNLALKSECDTLGVKHIDPSSISGVEAFFYDDCHFSEAGAQEMARLVARWFVEYQRKRVISE